MWVDHLSREHGDAESGKEASSATNSRTDGGGGGAVRKNPFLHLYGCFNAAGERLVLEK